MNLYELNQNIEEIFNYLETLEDQEQIDCLYGMLEDLKEEKEQKALNLSKWILNMLADVEKIKAEEKRLKAKRESVEKRAESVKNYVSSILDHSDKISDGVTSLSFRKSESVQVDEDILSKKWMKEKITYSPDKTGLKNAIKAGEVIEGAELKINYNLQVK